ncbi:MAG: NYN domain-containing protein [Pseudomonadota bacterium]
MHPTSSHVKVGVFIDGENIRRNGGHRMQYDVLREFACRDGALPQRLNTYLAYDPRRAEDDVQYMRRELNFQMSVRDHGYKVTQKIVRWYQDEHGDWRSKANADLDLAVDMLLQSENLDRVLLATGDGDFVRVINALQARGVRVEVVACENVSRELRREADGFVSAFLVPDLIPLADGAIAENVRWGDTGSRVRGVCHFHKAGYGFFRVLTSISANLWHTDSRDPASPYETVFFNDSDLPDSVDAGLLPSREHVFEFDLAAPRSDGEARQASQITLVHRL